MTGTDRYASISRNRRRHPGTPRAARKGRDECEVSSVRWPWGASPPACCWPSVTSPALAGVSGPRPGVDHPGQPRPPDGVRPPATEQPSAHGTPPNLETSSSTGARNATPGGRSTSPVAAHGVTIPGSAGGCVAHLWRGAARTGHRCRLPSPSSVGHRRMERRLDSAGRQRKGGRGRPGSATRPLPPGAAPCRSLGRVRWGSPGGGTPPRPLRRTRVAPRPAIPEGTNKGTLPAGGPSPATVASRRAVEAAWCGPNARHVGLATRRRR